LAPLAQQPCKVLPGLRSSPAVYAPSPSTPFALYRAPRAAHRKRCRAPRPSAHPKGWGRRTPRVHPKGCPKG